MNSIEAFRSEMAKHGIIYNGRIDIDGKLHRFKADGDKARNSWYILHPGKILAGAYGCWKLGINQTWHESGHKLSESELAEVKRQWAATEKIRQDEEVTRQAKAAKLAAYILDRAKAVDSHGYLTKKGIKAVGQLKIDRYGNLLIPLSDINDKLHSMQMIGEDGTKRFLTGGRIQGCFHAIGNTEGDKPFVLCEGFATGVSINQATGYPVFCAMAAGNLEAVAEAIRGKYPDMDVVIAGDNDAWTQANPGLKAATAAARAVNGRLAIPTFKDVSSRPSDYNDLSSLEGLPAVKAQIDAAQAPDESQEQILSRLANLSPLEFDKIRDAEAKKMGVRVSTLDSEVARLRPKTDVPNNQGSKISVHPPEPWPEPVNGNEILNEVAKNIQQFVVCNPEVVDAIALWIMHTHVFDVFCHTPKLNISAPERGCGKSLLLELVGLMSRSPLQTENVSSAALFRLIELYKPTMLIDECDTFLNSSEDHRGIINASHKRGGCVFRCEGDNNEVRGFDVFSPVALSGIGSIPETIRDRSIIIELQKALPNEMKSRFDSRKTEAQEIIQRKLARWAMDNRDKLSEIDPILPGECFNRIADNWRPLFAIAEAVGGDWSKRVCSSFHHHNTTTENTSLRTDLLADIRALFMENKVDRLTSAAICEGLGKMHDKPWPEFKNGKPITQTQLARSLRHFKIKSEDIRIGKNPPLKGYKLASFSNAFTRYLPEALTFAPRHRDIAASKTPRNADGSGDGSGDVALSRQDNREMEEREEEVLL